MNTTTTPQLFPTARGLGHRLTARNSFELPPFTIEKNGSLMVTGAVPMLVSVTVCMWMLRRYTWPKLIAEGETLSSGPVAVTVFVTCGAGA